MEMGEKMKFGVMEIEEFAKSHKDERVRILFRRYEEARRKIAMWCSRVADLEKQVEMATQWINVDGSPVDGFRFREEMLKLKSMI